MARVILSEASVRIDIDVRRAERDAERAGERYGKEYARGAEREGKRNPPKIPISSLDADFEKQVRATVAKISRTANANIPLTIKGEELRARTAVAIEEIERTLSARIPVNPADALEFKRKLALLVREANRGINAKIDVDVDKDGVRRVAETFGSLASGGVGLFSKVGDIVGSVSAQASSTFSALSGPVLTVLKLIFAIQYAVPAVAAGISLLGGAGVAAFGAIAAAGLGLPAVLAAVGAPIAAVILGMDGIKRAAAPLADEFKLLKDVVNIAFENTLRPVFERLQVIFPTLTTGLNETAQAVGRLASDLTDVVTSEAGIEDLRVALGGFSTVVDHSREGVSNLFSALLNVAGTRELYEILGDTIGGVAARFGNMIERVRASGALAGALTQLRDVLFGVVDVINILIEGSIKFFEAAGPGLTAFFASLGEIISRIDFASLGESFGGLLERLGTALENIPPEKWRELADSIGALAQKFVEMVESGKLLDLIEGFTGFINTLFTLKSILDGIEEGLNGFSDAIGGAGDAVYENFTKPIYDAVVGLLEYLGIASPAQRLIDIGIAIVEGLLLGLASGPSLVFGKMREIAQSVLNALGDAGTLLLDKGRQFVDGIRQGISDKLEDARAKAIEIKDRVKGALSNAGEALKQAGRDLVEGFISGIGSKIEDAARKAGEMARRAYNAAKSVLGISSPSRLFRELGLDTGAGLQVGIEDSTRKVLEAIGQMLGSVANLLPSGIGDTIAQALTSGVNGFAGQFAAAQQGVSVSQATQDAQAIAAALSSIQWVARFDGPNVVEIVNDGNRQLARR